MNRSHRFCFGLLVGLAFVFHSPTLVAQEKVKGVPVLVTWQGTIKRDLRKQIPANGHVFDAKEWEKLWKAWRGTEPMPVVNFKETIVLVAVSQDLNHIGVSPLLSKEGDLGLSISSTLIGFDQPTPEVRYVLCLVSRDGIKSIGGKAIPAK